MKALKIHMFIPGLLRCPEIHTEFSHGSTFLCDKGLQSSPKGLLFYLCNDYITYCLFCFVHLFTSLLFPLFIPLFFFLSTTPLYCPLNFPLCFTFEQFITLLYHCGKASRKKFMLHFALICLDLFCYLLTGYSKERAFI